jgi:hypothetical protein
MLSFTWHLLRNARAGESAFTEGSFGRRKQLPSPHVIGWLSAALRCPRY